MSKQNLRQKTLTLLKGQDKVLKRKMDECLCDALVAHPFYQSAKTVATYLPLPFELDTSFLIHHAREAGKRLLVPKVIGKGQMVFVDYDPSDLVLSLFGILEPRSDLAVPAEEIDLIHVPGVVFNPDGYRIGFGGGYYDRYLQEFQEHTLSTIYPIQQGLFEPDSHDIPVSEVLLYDQTI